MTTPHACARSVAVGVGTAMMVSLSVLSVQAPVLAEEVTPAGLDLTVAASDVTTTDADLATTAREVVVVRTGPAGPEVTKLRARSRHDADTLAADLDAQPGVTAEINTAIAAPEVRTTDVLAPGKGGSRIDLPSVGAFRASALPSLAAEPYGRLQWGLSAVNAEAAWAITQGQGVTVAIIDSGVDATHPDLAGRVLPQIDLVGDGQAGDPAEHGTHVAGIVAASLDGVGTAGLANLVTILSVRVLDQTGTSDGATVARGILEAVDAGAEVVNISIGGQVSSAAVESAVAHAVEHGVTVVAAGGNGYLAGNPVEYPAALPGVLAVSSIDADGFSSAFSNSGPYIDITAPGEDIWSTVPGGRWASRDGTSMAAPFVSAAAALVRVANPTLTKDQVDDVLLGTAQDDAAGDGPDDRFGHGLLQAERATVVAAFGAGGLREVAASARVKVKATHGRSKLFVNVNPNRGSGYWKFKLQRRTKAGNWRKVGTYRTRGRTEIRTVNPRRGRYRVVVKPKYGYLGVTSRAVRLTR